MGRKRTKGFGLFKATKAMHANTNWINGSIGLRYNKNFHIQPTSYNHSCVFFQDKPHFYENQDLVKTKSLKSGKYSKVRYYGVLYMGKKSRLFS